MTDKSQEFLNFENDMMKGKHDRSEVLNPLAPEYSDGKVQSYHVQRSEIPVEQDKDDILYKIVCAYALENGYGISDIFGTNGSFPERISRILENCRELSDIAEETIRNYAEFSTESVAGKVFLRRRNGMIVMEESNFENLMEKIEKFYPQGMPSEFWIDDREVREVREVHVSHEVSQHEQIENIEKFVQHIEQRIDEYIIEDGIASMNL